MWLLVLATTLALVVVVNGQKRPTISFISGAGSGEVVTDLGKSAELICQVLCPIEFMMMAMMMTMVMTVTMVMLDMKLTMIPLLTEHFDQLLLLLSTLLHYL